MSIEIVFIQVPINVKLNLCIYTNYFNTKLFSIGIKEPDIRDTKSPSI